MTQPAPSCTDHELIVAVRRGSDRAFEELYGRYRGRIGSYVLGMVGDHARAEDIAQEVFISALRRLRDTERPIAFKPWLYEIAKNACIDDLRRTRRMREVPLERDAPGVEPEPLQLAGSATPDSEVENRQRLRDLRGALYGLSESHHRIIVMRELEGLSYDQIGERLGMSKAMVESTLFRARKRLGEEYEELVSGRRCERIQAVIAAGDERPLRSLGIREKRQLALHLAHCQPCRRHARMAGVDESFFQTPGLIGKIAALLPIPWLRSRRSRDSSDTAGGVGGGHQLLALQSLQVMAPLAQPTGSSSGPSRAAAALAALAIAGAGGGIVSGIGAHDRQSRVSRPGATLPTGGPAAGVARARLGQTQSSTRSLRTGGGGSPGSGSGPGTVGAGAGAGPGVGAATGAGSGASRATSHATAPAPSPARAGAPSSSVTKTVGSVLQTAQGTVGAVTGSGSAVGNVTNTATQVVNSTTSTVTKLAGSGLPPILPGTNTSQLPKLPALPQPKLPALPQPQLPPLPQPQLPPLPPPKLPVPKLPPLPAPKLPAPKLPPLPAPKLPAPKLPSLPNAPVPQAPRVSTPPLPSVSTPKLPSPSTPAVPQLPQVAPTSTQSSASVLPPLGLGGH